MRGLCGCRCHGDGTWVNRYAARTVSKRNLWLRPERAGNKKKKGSKNTKVNKSISSIIGAISMIPNPIKVIVPIIDHKLHPLLIYSISEQATNRSKNFQTDYSALLSINRKGSQLSFRLNDPEISNRFRIANQKDNNIIIIILYY